MYSYTVQKHIDMLNLELTVSMVVNEPQLCCWRSQFVLHFLMVQKVRGRIWWQHVQFDLWPICKVYWHWGTAV